MRSLTYNRYIKKTVLQDLKSKIIFIGGPRQVGKTSFTLKLLKENKGDKHPAYLNWDIVGHRKNIISAEFPDREKLIIFDEIHKYARWRSLMKGFYDLCYPKKNAIVTGSARLDYYRKGGDSLQGRYYYYRLHPYSLTELNNKPTNKELELLLKFGGFPEPLSSSSERHWRRWRRDRISKIIEVDLRDLERVNEISLLEVLAASLPNKIGSPLSLQGLREDLEVSHDSIRRWLQIFENLYLTFRISPYGSPKIRAVKKEQKLYFWDWSQVEDEGARFENLVASQLLKYCHFLEDSEGYSMELRYLRDTDKREVDFVIIKDKKPIFAVECKSGEKNLNPAIEYFLQRTPIPKFYQIHMGTKDCIVKNANVRILPFIKFVSEFKMP